MHRDLAVEPMLIAGHTARPTLMQPFTQVNVRIVTVDCRWWICVEIRVKAHVMRADTCVES